MAEEKIEALSIESYIQKQEMEIKKYKCDQDALS